MLTIIICLCVGVISGFLLSAFLTTSKIQEHEELNDNIRRQNIEEEQKADKLKIEIDEYQKEIEKLKNEKSTALNDLSLLRRQSEKVANDYYDKSMEVASKAFEDAIEKKRNDYNFAASSYEDEYLNAMQEFVKSFQKQIKDKEDYLAQLDKNINDLQDKVDAAVEASKRAAEMQDKEDFYKLNLSAEDLIEISKLREVAHYLRDETPLNKVIWKVYYEKPCTDLVGRVVGGGVKTGIYKITNTQNNMCYVGQSVNIAERFRQHIRRGLGAETPTRNKLYPAMMAAGVENFTFEIIEECIPELLDEREDFYQDFFRAKEFGYSIK